jgi:excisionase family DNA binding protein
MLEDSEGVVLLRPHQVCKQLGVSRSWLYKAVSEGRIPHLRLGDDDGPVRFEHKALDDWLAESRKQWRPGNRL